MTLSAISSSSHTSMTDEDEDHEHEYDGDHTRKPIGLVKQCIRSHQNGGITQARKLIYMQDDVLSSSSGGYFLAKDESGETCCRIHGEAATMQNSGFDVPKVFFKNSKVFTDGWGRPLFTMRRKAMSLHQSSQLFDLTGKPLLETRGKFSFTKNRMTASFVNVWDNQKVDIEVVGKYTSRDAVMKLGDGRTVARIIRLYGDKYTVEVYPGVDVVLALALAVAFGERSQDGNRSAWTN